MPTGTYRLQLHAGFTFDDAATAVPYLADLGVSHVYCSPYLKAAPGSTHGYDVVDHSRLNPELGGDAAHERLVAACREHGLGLVLDVVPNHSAVSEPESQNAAWWDVLTHGRRSAYARWFDIDWDSPDNPGRVLVPVLGVPVGEAAASGELTLSADGTRVTYYDHEAPVAPGTLVRGDVLATLGRQHYRICQWRVAADELDYRRFFDVTTLAGVRVEEPDVFDATHALVLRQLAAGELDGLRIDHPDGLADPGGYLDRLADATGDSWVVVEKILEHGEELPPDWRCAGTTGYDALNRLTGLFVDPDGEEPLTRLYGEVTGEPTSFADVVEQGKAYVLNHVLRPEVSRLTELVVRAAWADPATRDLPRRPLREAVEALLAGFEVYRAYVTPGEDASAPARNALGRAVEAALAAAPQRRAEVELVARLVVSGPPELVVRFQQTCGPVMAKGVEDTAFYRYHRLDALNEVGGDPGAFGTSVAEFHQACAAAQRDWPLSMTTLSTHDTKRSEDVRARLVLLSEDPQGWAATARRLLGLAARHGRDGWPDANAAYLLVQTLVGAWPLSTQRALAYVEKASREAKQHTTWTDPDEAYDAALAGYVRGVLADEELLAVLTGYVEGLLPAAHATSLAQKLLQLTMPGIPDVYQGTEYVDLSLVDPDNRRPVDLAARAASLPEGKDDKQRVVAGALRLRRERPELFGAQASYRPLAAHGAAAAHVVAFTRSDAVVTVVPRLALGLGRRGGFGDTTLALPDGRWRNLLGVATPDGPSVGESSVDEGSVGQGRGDESSVGQGRGDEGSVGRGSVRLSDLLGGFPVALLVRD